MTILDQVRQLIADTLEVPVATVTADTASDNLSSWDSVGHVNLMMALEQTFDLMLDVEVFPTLTSVAAILAFLDAQGLR